MEDQTNKDFLNVVGNKQSIGIVSDEKALSVEDVDKRIEVAIKAAEEHFLKKAKEEVDKQMQAAQTLYVTIFGIFASIISLFTVEFQILKMCEGVHQIISFNLFLVASLLGFILALDYVVTSKSQSRRLMFVLVAMLFAMGIFLSLWYE